LLLPVQVAGLDVAHALWLGRTQQDQIGGKRITAFDSNNIANSDGMPSPWNKGASFQGFGQSCICLAIRGMAFLSMKEIKKGKREKAMIRIHCPEVTRARERHSD
jgi:hypothetical protein